MVTTRDRLILDPHEHDLATCQLLPPRPEDVSATAGRYGGMGLPVRLTGQPAPPPRLRQSLPEPPRSPPVPPALGGMKAGPDPLSDGGQPPD